MTTDSVACDQVGDEFNNLREINKYGPNPYQDPTRGRIAAFDETDYPTGTDQSTPPSELLQNLEGDESIIGRSVTMTTTDATPSDSFACCVIGIDTPPTRY